MSLFLSVQVSHAIEGRSLRMTLLYMLITKIWTNYRLFRLAVILTIKTLFLVMP